MDATLALRRDVGAQGLRFVVALYVVSQLNPDEGLTEPSRSPTTLVGAGVASCCRRPRLSSRLGAPEQGDTDNAAQFSPAHGAAGLRPSVCRIERLAELLQERRLRERLVDDDRDRFSNLPADEVLGIAGHVQHPDVRS